MSAISDAAIPALGTIIGVGAHPDDEAYLSARIMATAVRAGSRVVCVTATRGEAGSQDPDRWPPPEMRAIREAELEACLATLGVDEHHWLDYVDGTCASVPAEEGIGAVLAVLHDVGPDTVLTFGPEGMTGHPDHMTVSAWVTEAFRRWGGAGAGLHYATRTPAWAGRFATRLSALGVYAPGTPPLTPPEELSIECYLPAPINDLKVAALRAQVS